MMGDGCICCNLQINHVRQSSQPLPQFTSVAHVIGLWSLYQLGQLILVILDLLQCAMLPNQVEALEEAQVTIIPIFTSWTSSLQLSIK